MGFCFFGSGPLRGKLCCDVCSGGPGYKRPCPFGYCPAASYCSKCWKSGAKEKSAAYHASAGCEAKHAAYVARDQKRLALLASGEPVRSAAQGLEGEQVKVWFQVKDAPSLIVHMHKSVYDAFSLLEPVSLGDFEAAARALKLPAPVLQ